MKTRTRTRTPNGKFPYVIRPLQATDRDRICAHLLALDPADRFLRFGAATDADAVDRYVDAIAFDRGAVLGVEGPDGVLIGLGHLALGDDFAELGISVSNAHRQRGVARALADRALRAAEDIGAGEFRLHFAATNDAMRRLARQLGMEVSADGSEKIARRVLPAANAAGAAQGALRLLPGRAPLRSARETESASGGAPLPRCACAGLKAPQEGAGAGCCRGLAVAA